VDPKTPIYKQLYSIPFEFQFHQAVRLLARLPDAVARQDAAKSDFTLEVARFKTHLSLSFAASEIQSLTPPAAPLVVPQLSVTFMGLFGTYGVLPRHYTQKLLELDYLRRRNPDQEFSAFCDWLDIFNHRMIWYFYRAWEKYRFPIPYERGEYRHSRTPDTFTQAMLSVIGIGTASLRNRFRISLPSYRDPPDELVVSDLPDLSLFRFSGALSQRHRNQWGLKAFLEGILQVQVSILQFRGQWLPLEQNARVQIGMLGEDGTGGELGVNVIVGDKIWDIQGKICIRVGPLTYNQFLELLPDRQPVPERKSFLYLSQLARLYVGLEFDIDIQLVLKAAEIPACRLTDDPITGPHLGWTSWLIIETPKQDAEEAVFDSCEDPWLTLDPDL